MYDSRYDSKMHNIIIPLMGFKGFHHASNHESKDDFEDFIGRESILDKLYAWLEDREAKKSKKYSGAYLITGFRGMGKSSFVYKAILDIKKKAKKHRFTTCHYVPISINVGNDLLTSKELLYIICKLLSVSFDEKTRIGHNKRSRLNLLICRLLIILGAVYLLYVGYGAHYMDFIKAHTITWFYQPLESILAVFNKLLQSVVPLSSHSWFSICIVVSTILFCYLARYLYYLLWRMTDWDFFITTWQIKRTFKHLNERIDSEMTKSSEYGIDSSENSAPHESVPGLRFIRGKKNVYRIAQTSEIQDLLVYQLRLIKRLWLVKFRFIFIIDELDKVSPEDNEKEIIPEYEYTNAVKGNSSYRSRQKALAGLLANMKYFISSSEAKFIFITGYDMYEATLADISNREFNIHSIFNGYINVNSFLRKTGKSSGSDSMIEEYFCHMLLRAKDSKREDLRDYANFCRAEWQNNGPRTQEETKNFEMLLERRIIFLRHFLTYLFYMSNGSPKKLAIYLEKYVRSKTRIERLYEDKPNDERWAEYDEISLGIKPYWDKCEWFLYFDERSIQKVEFISYLIYPMLKNLIAKSSIYNDKLLVSTSFMISNLYKFHKSGFSWRNLEYMPELLDINKTPELRDFIGGILQFLNQTHIDEAVSNLYKFKFPQRLSEEITFFSKMSEEVSHLFNFSHDELLSIKTLYNKQLDHYKKDNRLESPALASLHHLLGDIYMLEENYEQAIFEFGEALNSIKKQEEDDPRKIKDSSNVLFRMRVNLKLGLAYEKRKTFDTAYVTYENIVRSVLGLASHALYLALPSSDKSTAPFNSKHYMDGKSSIFSNIRIAYLGILAKIAVIEKMDIGGINDRDLWRLVKEFEFIQGYLDDEIRPVAIIDFYTKLGIILYYKNNSSNNELPAFRIHLGLTTGTDNSKYDECTKIPVKLSLSSKGWLLTPCLACQCYNKSITTCFEELKGNIADYEKKSKAIFFLEQFCNRESYIEIQKKGNHFIQAMSNTLVGLANTLLGCAKINTMDCALFFKSLHEACLDLDTDKDTSDALNTMDQGLLCPYTKSFLYYLAAAEAYKMLTDYRSAYGIYIQILDAVSIYYRIYNKSGIPKQVLEFCQYITEKAIHFAYLHYDSISCAEVDTQKYEFGKTQTEYINFHSLTVFPEVEVAIDKYYRICLMGDIQEQDSVLKKLINSRQFSSYKLTSNLMQHVQNLSLKVMVNEIILSRIIPEMGDSFNQLELNIGKTISWITNYYTSLTSSQLVDNLLKKIEWGLVQDDCNINEKKFILLDYLLKDSLYCLTTITGLLEPLYSSTLYNDSYIGELYRKSFYWNHILISIRELFSYAEAEDKYAFKMSLRNRYSSTRESINFSDIEKLFDKSDEYLKSLQSWTDYCPKDISRIDSIYQKISSGESNFLTSSYLQESAVDRLNKAVEMHTSGKAYQEMMTTLFFLEDDFQNDSNYMHLAIERFLINHGVIQDRLFKLKSYAINKNTLLHIDHYVKP